MNKCPFCGSETEEIIPPLLSKRQRDIYDAVAAAGRKGIKPEGLLKVMYGSKVPESGWGILRVNVFEINRKLRETGRKIKGLRSVGYMLVKD